MHKVNEKTTKLKRIITRTIDTQMQLHTTTELPNQATIYIIQFTKLKNTKTQKVLKKNFT